MKERFGPVGWAVQRLLALPDPVMRRLAGGPAVTRDGRTLDLRVQAILNLGRRLGLVEDSSSDGTLPRGDTEVEERRRGLSRFGSLAMPTRPGLHVVDRRIPGPAGEIPVRTYRRFGLAERSPGIVYLHGGGWVSGDLESHDGTCRLLADISECVVMAVDYRLAPEHPFPAAIDDALAAYRWFHDRAAETSVDPDRIGVMGDSAGGNIAAVIAQVLRETDVAPPHAQCLVYPATDMRMREASVATFSEGFMLTRASMEWFRSKYVPDEADWDSPLASPIEQPDLRGVAPALVVTAGFDPLRDEGFRYAQRLAEAGVRTRYRCYDDMIHGFFGMGVLPQGMNMAAEICMGMADLMHEPF